MHDMVKYLVPSYPYSDHSHLKVDPVNDRHRSPLKAICNTMLLI